MLLVSKIANVVKKDDNEKRKEIFEVALGIQDKFRIQAVDLLQAKLVLERLVLSNVYCYLTMSTVRYNHVNEKFYQSVPVQIKQLKMLHRENGLLVITVNHKPFAYKQKPSDNQ